MHSGEPKDHEVCAQDDTFRVPFLLPWGVERTREAFSSASKCGKVNQEVALRRYGPG